MKSHQANERGVSAGCVYVGNRCFGGVFWRVLVFGAAFLTTGFFTTGCALEYEEPTVDEPWQEQAALVDHDLKIPETQIAEASVIDPVRLIEVAREAERSSNGADRSGGKTIDDGRLTDGGLTDGGLTDGGLKREPEQVSIPSPVSWRALASSDGESDSDPATNADDEPDPQPW